MSHGSRIPPLLSPFTACRLLRTLVTSLADASRGRRLAGGTGTRHKANPNLTLRVVRVDRR
jgi:hypothetical protein